LSAQALGCCARVSPRERCDPRGGIRSEEKRVSLGCRRSVRHERELLLGVLADRQIKGKPNLAVLDSSFGIHHGLVTQGLDGLERRRSALDRSEIHARFDRLQRKSAAEYRALGEHGALPRLKQLPGSVDRALQPRRSWFGAARTATKEIE